MNARCIALPALAAALLVVGFVSIGCGGGDGDGGEGLTLQEYFQRLDGIFDDADGQFDALEEQCQPADSSAEAQNEAFRCFFDASFAVFDKSLDEIADVNPPAEVKDAHEEYLDSGAGVSRFIGEFLEGPKDNGSVTDLSAFLADPELEEASQRFDNACSGLQLIADENEIDVDLGCED
jgi:hypothetical protein